ALAVVRRRAGVDGRPAGGRDGRQPAPADRRRRPGPEVGRTPAALAAEPRAGQSDEFGLAGRLGDVDAVKPTAVRPGQVAEHALRIFVKVQESLGFQVEDAALLLFQVRQLADFVQQAIDPVQVVVAGVSHGSPSNTRYPLISAIASISRSPAVSP